MKKSWMLFLIVFLTGAVNEIKAVRGHRACMEQGREAYQKHEPREYKVSYSDAMSYKVLSSHQDRIRPWCCGEEKTKHFRTRRLAALKNIIHVGDTLRYYEEYYWRGQTNEYMYWQVIAVDAQHDRFEELFTYSRNLTEDENNAEEQAIDLMYSLSDQTYYQITMG